MTRADYIEVGRSRPRATAQQKLNFLLILFILACLAAMIVIVA